MNVSPGKCSRRPIRPASRHYGYGEVRSATTKSGRRKIARPVVATISQNSVALQGTQNRTPPTTPCEVLRRALVSLLSSCRIASAEPGSPRIQCGCVMLFDPWPRHEHHTVAHAHHRQPGRRRSRQTHPRRHARTLGDGQQPDTPASLAARALSRDGVRGSASTWGSIRIASSMERTMWPVTPDQ